MAEWLLYGMMGIPLVCGVLALLAGSDRLRNGIAALSAVAVATPFIFRSRFKVAPDCHPFRKRTAKGRIAEAEGQAPYRRAAV